jgi:DNA (cytosine-5)-methyltransferase 1
MLRALDLFCGAGGATKGLQLAGFHVTGVDFEPQPHYCGDQFIQKSVFDLEPWVFNLFDLLWASPKCQASTILKHMHNAKKHEDQIPATRALLQKTGKPYIIENVMGASLLKPFVLDGTMFGLETSCGAQLLRPRQFETSFEFGPTPLSNKIKGRKVIGVYGGHLRCRIRRDGSHARGIQDFPIAEGYRAMGIDWMTLGELSQAIPPAYSKFIANRWRQHVQTSAIAA